MFSPVWLRRSKFKYTWLEQTLALHWKVWISQVNPVQTGSEAISPLHIFIKWWLFFNVKNVKLATSRSSANTFHLKHDLLCLGMIERADLQSPFGSCVACAEVCVTVLYQNASFWDVFGVLEKKKRRSQRAGLRAKRKTNDDGSARRGSAARLWF